MKIFITLSAVCLALLTLTSGCVTGPSQPLPYKVETTSGGGVAIQSARVLPEGNGIKVMGMVRRDLGYYGTVYRHLDLAIIGPSGNIISRQAATFRPNPIPFSPRYGLGRANYEFILKEAPPLHSVIRITVDQTLLADCKLVKTDK